MIFLITILGFNIGAAGISTGALTLAGFSFLRDRGTCLATDGGGCTLDTCSGSFAFAAGSPLTGIVSYPGRAITKV